MRNLWKRVLALWVIGMGLGVSATAQAASGVGPYYAMPSWDQTLPAATRFIVLTNMGSAAVLDRETGLVWEQSPSITGGPNNDGTRNWQDAQIICNVKAVGSRYGWRLPTIQELASLADPANPGGNPALPPGHPFNVQSSSNYWSATTYSGNATDAWLVSYGGDPSFGVGFTGRIQALHVWCVRGGQGVDSQ